MSARSMRETCTLLRSVKYDSRVAGSIPGATQARPGKQHNSIQQISELARIAVVEAFSFHDDFEPVVFRFPRDGEPLQLLEERGQLGRGKTAGNAWRHSLRSRIGCEDISEAILGNDREDGRAGQTRESRLPFRAVSRWP